jgi:hypothetical protein
LERLKGYQKSLILAVILAVVAFFWIWLYQYIGGNGYWAALVSFAVYVAYGAIPKKLPWMVLGTVAGVVFGVITVYLSLLVFPMNAVISAAIAGAILLLIGALVSVPRMREMLPMTVVGWGCLVGTWAQYTYLVDSQVVWAIPKLISSFFGVLLSLMVGLLLGALVATPLLARTAKTAAAE